MTGNQQPPETRPTGPTAPPLRTVTIPPGVLRRYNARILDPTTAVQIADQPAILPTVYIADSLLISARHDADVLSDVVKDHRMRLVPPVEPDESADDRVASEPRERAARRASYVAAARRIGHPDAETMFPEVHRLVPADGAAVAPDAWAVLQSYRLRVKRFDVSAEVGLDHLFTATHHVTPGPYEPPPAGASAPASASYGEPGCGGRQPVGRIGWTLERQKLNRHPVVAVLDTGTGEHPWLPLGANSCVHRNPTCGGVLIGLGEPSLTEQTGVVTDPLEGVLDPYSGHGTFIAGLIRQHCADADILSVRIMPSEGAVPEHVLLDALHLLVLRQWAAQNAKISRDNAIDVVSLSLGYYDETPSDYALNTFLAAPLRALGELGVAVVASAGNDATTRPMFPAAFWKYNTLPPWTTPPPWIGVPVVGVGATNPDGTVALFSNSGAWVTCLEPGAALVSTFPKFDGSAQADYRAVVGEDVRSTIDPDNFESGWGVWSGTSFAAPVLAGKIAKHIVAAGADSIGLADMRARAMTALADLLRRPELAAPPDPGDEQ